MFAAVDSVQHYVHHFAARVGEKQIFLPLLAEIRIFDTIGSNRVGAGYNYAPPNVLTKSAIVIMVGKSISNDKKSLSPVTNTSTFSKMAVARIGASFGSRMNGIGISLQFFGV